MGHEYDEALLDLEHKSNDELRAILNGLRDEEQRISYRRRVLHGKIDILRAELVQRLQAQHESGEDVISGRDVERLIDILARDLRGVSNTDVAAGDSDHEADEGA
ncbi:MAG: hypothetical protein KGZ40_05685 [Clostridiales bacterium]|nr:hypothetical protein [Clostridiales bacterium]